MRPLRSASMALIALLSARDGSFAQSTPTAAHTTATLVSDTSTIVPGQPFTVAIVFKIEPTWHLYFKDPGDSGMPPKVKWTLPEGLTAGELQFPKPEVLKSPAGTNYVYEGEVALLVTLTPGKDVPIARSLDLSAALKWLECDADTCVPQKQTATLSVTADEKLTPANVEAFKAWREKVKAGESFDPSTAK